MGSADLWKKWEGRVIDGKFPLRQWLGGSDHSAVFLTERKGGSQKAAIKLITAQDLSADARAARLSRWAQAAKLSHPHLLKVFEFGRGQIEGTQLLYVVMECAEEDLSQILPERALGPTEVEAMLPPVVEALSYLHQTGLAHGRVKTSNVMAAGDQLKLSVDTIRTSGEIGGNETAAFDAPEAHAGSTPATDIWSLGVLLITVLTQRESNTQRLENGEVSLPVGVPEPFATIARRCLRADPQQRITLDEILGKAARSGAVEPKGRDPRVDAVGKPTPNKTRTPWMAFAAIAALVLVAALFGRKILVQKPDVPSAATHSASSDPSAENTPTADAPAPFNEGVKTARGGTARGSVLHQVSPEVSRSAQKTIQGRVKIGVHVAVDASGKVSQANLVGAASSSYFANRALAAARGWKFNPPRVDGQPLPSEWLLRFQFGATGTQAYSSQIKP